MTNNLLSPVGIQIPSITVSFKDCCKFYCCMPKNPNVAIDPDGNAKEIDKAEAGPDVNVASGGVIETMTKNLFDKIQGQLKKIGKSERVDLENQFHEIIGHTAEELKAGNVPITKELVDKVNEAWIAIVEKAEVKEKEPMDLSNPPSDSYCSIM